MWKKILQFNTDKMANQEQKSEKIIDTYLPLHVAIIMDGNGRWAKKRGYPRTVGHQQGVLAMKEIVKAAARLGIAHLTVYAFSTENWRRPETEVNFLIEKWSQPASYRADYDSQCIQ